MHCTWMLAICAAPLSIPNGGWAQLSPATATPPVASAHQPEDEAPEVEVGRLEKQLAELKKQRGTLIAKLVAEYLARPESQQISQERGQAGAALKAATDQALSRVREDPQYRRELAKKQEMQVRLQTLKTAAKPDPVQITQAATAYHQANMKLVQMEEDAQGLDQQVSAAKVRLANAEVAEADLQRRAQAYATLHDEYATLMVTIWQTETSLDRANADLRVAIALTHSGERRVERAETDDTAFWRQGFRKVPEPMITHTTTGPKLSDPLPIMPGTLRVPPLDGPSGEGRRHIIIGGN